MKHMQLPLSTKFFDSCDYWLNHHESHAAAAYYTSGFSEDVVCVVIDAIGEWDTCSIWTIKNKVGVLINIHYIRCRIATQQQCRT